MIQAEVLDFLNYAFMRNALLGTMVVNKKMAFFSDAIGHSALCGIAVGVV
ncbi:MAG: metal ABC transporter permease, partial [Clostridiales bacterium]|nr:metal ABC transporter permease [Clostridiales bacterium]